MLICLLELSEPLQGSLEDVQMIFQRPCQELGSKVSYVRWSYSVQGWLLIVPLFWGEQTSCSHSTGLNTIKSVSGSSEEH